MKIQEWNLNEWCRKATSLIESPPDRKKVSQELRNHLDDHCDALTKRGMTFEEAVEKTLTAMGDPLDIAPTLAAIHHPFWGYFLRTARIIMAVLLVLLMISGWVFIGKQDIGTKNYDEVYWPEDGYTQVFTTTEDGSFTDSGYLYSLGKTTLWRSGDDRRLSFHITQTSIIPCFASDKYRLNFHSDLPFWAQDSLGNRYDSYDFDQGSASFLSTYRSQSGIFTWTHECMIIGLSPDATWVDIYYDRDGRNHVLHIDLMGGNGQ